LHKDLQAAIAAADELGENVDLARLVDSRFEALSPLRVPD
jgi:hypothetical protein